MKLVRLRDGQRLQDLGGFSQGVCAVTVVGRSLPLPGVVQGAPGKQQSHHPCWVAFQKSESLPRHW